MIKKYLDNIHLPQAESHKGQNGKLLIIGGSELFHAASKWSLDIASKFVDMVFYASVPENNELIREAKKNFWNGIVIERDAIRNYIEEADCVLIGPGMTRDEKTKEMVDQLITTYPQKKWVIDAGALQMIEPNLLNQNCIITPHRKELEMLLQKTSFANLNDLRQIAQNLEGVTILLKGVQDIVTDGTNWQTIEGGNPGMTKGGTGDVLAGLVAALYCQHDAITAAVVASYINKKAGDSLYTKVGTFFNASDLVTEVPKVFWKELHT